MVKTRQQVRNLKQYKDLSEEEFEEVYLELVAGETSTKDFEERINHKIDDFAKDYDLSDLKINDLLTLRALAQAYITLEDFERYSFKLRQKGLDEIDVVRLEKINKILGDLRRDISNLQNDLKITRRIRKGDQEESVINFIESLKRKARTFYYAKMRPVVCPECKTWIASVWALYPDDKQSKVRFHCHRRFPDGTTCKGKVEVDINELYRLKPTDYLPENVA